MLKEIAPRLTRVAMLRDAANPSGTGFFGALQSVAPSLGIEASPIGLRDTGEIERGVTSFARGANGGLIVTPTSFSLVHRDLIIALAAKHRLPAVYPFGHFVRGGGLIASFSLVHRDPIIALAAKHRLRWASQSGRHSRRVQRT